MKTPVKMLMFIIFTIIVLFLTSCSDSTKPDNTPNDLSGANAYARQGMNQLNDEADRLSNVQDITNENDLMLETTFDQIKAKFQQALTLDADNPMANLGMAILEIVRVNYDPELWNLYNDVDSLGTNNKGVLNHQFEFLSRVPVLLAKNYTVDSKSALSIKRFQDFIVASVNPRLESALVYLNTAVNLADSSVVYVDTGEEMLEVDRGEIYAFRASIQVLNAAFYMLTCYNWDMVGVDGSYNWINQMTEDFAPDNYYGAFEPYTYEVVDHVLKLHYWDYYSRDDFSSVYRAEIMAKILKHNLANTPAFGTLNAARLLSAKTNILAAASDIRNGISFIEHETDPQSNDVIKLEYITDLNDEILHQDPDSPPFMQDWVDVNDAVNWLESLVNGGNYTTTTNDGIEFTINLSTFFSGAVPDIKAVKPFFHWNTATGTWLVPETYMNSWSTNSCSFWLNGEYITVDDIYSLEEYYDYYSVDAGYFTTSEGGPEIADGETPYFPDYTFHGIFPGMTRAKFVQLFGN